VAPATHHMRVTISPTRLRDRNIYAMHIPLRLADSGCVCRLRCMSLQHPASQASCDELTIPTLGLPELNWNQGPDLFASQRLAARGLPIGKRWSPPAAGVLIEIMRPAQQLHNRLTLVSAFLPDFPRPTIALLLRWLNS
jgi:hypothetical protein